jgi:hypothetical protein
LEVCAFGVLGTPGSFGRGQCPVGINFSLETGVKAGLPS